MTGDTPPHAPPLAAVPAPPVRSGRSRAPWIVAALAFLLGVAAVIALLPVAGRWIAASYPVAQPITPVTVMQPTVTAAAPVTMEGLAAREAALDAQLRAIEARVAATDGATRTASGYATRAEGMMIAFAARRALDRGLALGYVESQLRERFGADEAAAVGTVAAAARAPVTLQDLRLALDTIAPQLTGASTRDGFWRAIGHSLSDLVVLRRETTPSPRPADRLTRAQRLIDSGNVEAALAEIARMPGAAGATSWIDAAKRYIDARRALDRIELAAINGRAAAPAALSAPSASSAPPDISAGVPPGA